MTTVWVNGCFDILHNGHIELFEFAKSKGDRLVVGIDSDYRVKKLKGPNRPINSTLDRIKMLKAIRYIDEVTYFGTEDQLCQCVEMYDTNIMVVGSDYKDKKVVGSHLVDEVIYFDKVGDYSSTNTIEKIKKIWG